MIGDVSAKSPQTANEHGFSRFSKTFYGPLTFSEAVCVDGKILRVVPLFLTLFLPFTERVSPGLGLKREQKPTVRLFGMGEMLAKVPLTVLSLYKGFGLEYSAYGNDNEYKTFSHGPNIGLRILFD